MPDILNSYKTESIIDVYMPKDFDEWLVRAIPDTALRLALRPIFELVLRQKGARGLHQVKEDYQKYLSKY